MAQYELPIQIETEEGDYFASCLIWSDCYAQWGTIDEAVAEIIAVAGSLIEIYQEQNLEISLKVKAETFFLKKSLIQVPVFVPAVTRVDESMLTKVKTCDIFFLKMASLNNDLVTKGFLKKALEPFITKKDLKEELERFATKDDLRRFATKDDVLDLEEKFEKIVTEFKDRILSGVDRVMAEVKAMREEQTVHTGQHRRLNDEIEDHEERIEKLEGQAFA